MFKHQSLQEFNDMNKKGFTIVETLIAITVLMIAISGPLAVANKALTAAVDARNQLIATNLAQEALEFISLMKDAGVLWSSNAMSCNDPLNPCAIAPKDSEPISASLIDNYISSCSQASPYNNCKMTYESTVGYTYNSSNEASPFKRYFYVNSIQPDQLLATVVVEWQTGANSNQVKLQEILTSYRR